VQAPTVLYFGNGENCACFFGCGFHVALHLDMLLVTCLIVHHKPCSFSAICFLSSELGAKKKM